MRKSETAASRCKTISTVQKLLGGKYKIELLWYIGKCDIRRFGQLRRQIGEITESSLAFISSRFVSSAAIDTVSSAIVFVTAALGLAAVVRLTVAMNAVLSEHGYFHK